MFICFLVKFLLKWVGVYLKGVFMRFVLFNDTFGCSNGARAFIGFTVASTAVIAGVITYYATRQAYEVDEEEEDFDEEEEDFDDDDLDEEDNTEENLEDDEKVRILLQPVIRSMLTSLSNCLESKHT